MTTLSRRLTDGGLPAVREQFAHPTVRGIARGDLDPAVFGRWLEQDYLFLHDYARVLSRLAGRTPAGRPDHLGHLVDLAHATWHDELALHRSLAAEFGARLDRATPGPACRAYTEFLLTASDDYGRGLAALLPCMWGYSTLGGMLAADPPTEPRYARWVATYADPAFAAQADQCARMLDEAHRDDLVDEPAARAAFDEAMAHELAFWTVL